MSLNVASHISKFMGTICSVLRDKMVKFEDLYVSVMLTKCLPILLYGICSLHLSSISLFGLSVIWHTIFHWIFRYRKYESMRMVLLKCNSKPFIFLYEQWLLSLYCQLLRHDGRLLCKIACWSSCSDYVKAINKKYGIMWQFKPALIKSNVCLYYCTYCA